MIATTMGHAMSETTLYQIDKTHQSWRMIEKYIDAGVLVPVERCEHGNIDGHEIYRVGVVEHEIDWCDGAGIGDNGGND